MTESFPCPFCPHDTVFETRTWPATHNHPPMQESTVKDTCEHVQRFDALFEAMESALCGDRSDLYRWEEAALDNSTHLGVPIGSEVNVAATEVAITRKGVAA